MSLFPSFSYQLGSGYGKIKDPNDNIRINATLDHWSLRPFVEREQDFFGLIPVNAALASALKGLWIRWFN
jgi:hypothetical protein